MNATASGYTLDNVETRNRDHLTTFEIESRRDRDGLQSGDLAKLTFRDADGFRERMWVRVTRFLSMRKRQELTQRVEVDAVAVETAADLLSVSPRAVRFWLVAEPCPLPAIRVNGRPILLWIPAIMLWLNATRRHR